MSHVFSDFLNFAKSGSGVCKVGVGVNQSGSGVNLGPRTKAHAPTAYAHAPRTLDRGRVDPGRYGARAVGCLQWT